MPGELQFIAPSRHMCGFTLASISGCCPQLLGDESLGLLTKVLRDTPVVSCAWQAGCVAGVPAMELEPPVVSLCALRHSQALLLPVVVFPAGDLG